ELIGGKGTDYASYETAHSLHDDGSTGVRASLTDDRGFVGEAKGDTFKGMEGLIGSGFNDTLTGSTGVDTLVGGYGDDVLQGGGREDTLWGDVDAFGTSGSDTFVMNLPTAGEVKIMDFDAFDHVGINRKAFGLDAGFKFEDGVSFITAPGATATGKGPTLLFDQDTKKLSFDADGADDGAALVLATVRFDSQLYLDINDIVLI
ncbi:MAG: hypothetical protein ABW275_12070, partial [Hansschlegelia sp.]